jgi:penicillin amidase
VGVRRAAGQSIASLLRGLALCLACVVGGCRNTPPSPPAPLGPQVSGTLVLPGLASPVRIVRDRWGVPHIYAESQDDLFVAQGFVQAQDRLFQMDLWRRAVQGRLAEVLGANFIERDAMTRRFQYRGDFDGEWASYGPDTKPIAAAFVRGINAWVARALEHPPDEFVRAGWKPAFWLPVDLLNRTDAFLASGDAIEEVRRSKLHDVVADAVRRVGTPPFFSTMAAPVSADQTATRSDGGAAATRGGFLSFSDARHNLSHPSFRYIVHLKAPGWNVIGLTSPWLPGVAAGHNERVAWSMTPLGVDTQDLYAESMKGPKTVVHDAIIVKGRGEPFVYETELTRHGVVVAFDRANNLEYAVRWSGTEPGAAAELAALAVDRAGTWTDFRAALARWKMPARRALYIDVERNVGFQEAALVPIRRAREWRGWLRTDSLPHGFNPASGSVSAHGLGADKAISRQAVFAHVLGTGVAARQRFNIGPVDRPPDDDSPVRAVLEPQDWDRSRAINAPGQSESPDSPHFADLARLWSSGEYFPLVFSAEAVRANTEAILTLEPPR